MFLFKEREAKVIHTRIAGVSYENRQDTIKDLNEDSELYLVREPENEYDKHAIALYAVCQEEDKKIGYLPKEYAKVVSQYMDTGESVIVQLLRKKKEEYGYIDKEKKEEKRWEFIGLEVGLIF